MAIVIHFESEGIEVRPLTGALGSSISPVKERRNALNTAR